MNIIPDLMFEREKLRSQLKKWKWFFFLLLIAAIFVIGARSSSPKKPFIANINIEGVIGYDAKLISKLKELAENPDVKAVILNIDSPGSTAFAGEELYVNLKKLSQKKPIVSVLKTVAASGGYMISLATDHIIARNMTITGSIGVLWQSFEAIDLADKLGIKFVSVKSSPLKASPNPMEPMSDAAKAVVIETIEDNYQVFLSMLMEGREMDKEQASKIANGQVFTGRQAKELGLIDEIGGEDEARMWLETEKKISSKLKTQDITWDEPDNIYKEFLKFLNISNSIMNSEFFTKILNENNKSMLLQ